MTPPLFIRSIQQKDNYTFIIQWNDGVIQHFRLCDLQRECSCARCEDEKTGVRLINANVICDNVKAVTIRNVGCYGLRIQFSSGCSSGIYSFEKLRTIKGLHA